MVPERLAIGYDEILMILWYAELFFRLSNDLNIAWKQIAVAYRKWAVRYISECSGQQEHQYHTKRLVKIARNLNDLVYQGKIRVQYASE